jgi:hypothetical protein
MYWLLFLPGVLVVWVIVEIIKAFREMKRYKALWKELSR